MESLKHENHLAEASLTKLWNERQKDKVTVRIPNIPAKFIVETTRRMVADAKQENIDLTAEPIKKSELFKKLAFLDTFLNDQQILQ